MNHNEQRKKSILSPLWFLVGLLIISSLVIVIPVVTITSSNGDATGETNNGDSAVESTVSVSTSGNNEQVNISSTSNITTISLQSTGYSLGNTEQLSNESKMSTLTVKDSGSVEESRTTLENKLLNPTEYNSSPSDDLTTNAKTDKLISELSSKSDTSKYPIRSTESTKLFNGNVPVSSSVSNGRITSISSSMESSNTQFTNSASNYYYLLIEFSSG
ncbi:hypothetical protein SNEBB_008851 [Seison nebaliae]|nr:hypothetical protein SNEBB_008851 [Seison nebaliae]